MTTLLNRTAEENTQSLANQLPPGGAFGSRNVTGSNLRRFLDGLAIEVGRVNDLLALFRAETLPDETTKLLEEWESAVGIPDSCLLGTGTIDERREHVLIKLAALGIQTAAQFEALAFDGFNLTVTVNSGAQFFTFPAEFPLIFFPDEQTSRFTIVVDHTSERDAFTYTFPFTFTTSDLTILECIFGKLKPANCDLLFRQV